MFGGTTISIHSAGSLADFAGRIVIVSPRQPGHCRLLSRGTLPRMYGGTKVGTRSLCALSALAFCSLLAMANDDARAQQVSGASAAKVCREKITAGVLKVKHIGPVEALHGATFRRSYGGNLNRGPDIVPESNVRLFRTRVQYSNILGMPLDSYAICFFEIRGSSYRFVQICGTKGLTSTFSNCNLSWIVTDSRYGKVKKERKKSR